MSSASKERLASPPAPRGPSDFIASGQAAEMASSEGAGGLGVLTGRPRPRPPKLYRIGEVVSYAGVSRQTVHNYTIMGLLREARWTNGGHRLYDESVFQRIDDLAEMKARGKNLQEIREHFARIDAREA